MSKSRIVLAYLVLVGVPVLGLLAIIRAGRMVVPPLSVGGAWNLDANFNSLPDSSCSAMLNGIAQPFFTVSQSGSSLLFTLSDNAKSTLPGSIQGTAVTAGPGRSGAAPGAQDDCTNPQSIYLLANVSKQGGQRVLIGTLGVTGCVKCLPIPFHAVRQPSPSGRGR